MVAQEGVRILMQRHGLGSATLDDVLLALLDGAQATISTGKLQETTGNFSTHFIHLHAHQPAPLHRLRQTAHGQMTSAWCAPCKVWPEKREPFAACSGWNPPKTAFPEHQHTVTCCIQPHT